MNETDPDTADAALETCSYIKSFCWPNVAFTVPFGLVKILLSVLGIWLNHKVLDELQVVRKQQIVNTLIFYACRCCLVISCLHLVEAFRFVLPFEWIWYNEWLSYAYLLAWHFLTTVINTLILFLAGVRYLYVFKKSTIRALRQESHLSWSCALFAVILSVLASLIMESVMERPMFHAMWLGDKAESNKDSLLTSLFFACMVLADIYGLYLYSRIGKRQNTGVAVGEETPADPQQRPRNSNGGGGAFFNLMEEAAPGSSGGTASSSVAVISDRALEMASKGDTLEKQEQQQRRTRNFVPWQVHRHVLVVSALSIVPLIVVFLFMGPLCTTPGAFWVLNCVLSLQVTLTSLGPPLCQLRYWHMEKFWRRRSKWASSEKKYEVDSNTIVENYCAIDDIAGSSFHDESGLAFEASSTTVAGRLWSDENLDWSLYCLASGQFQQTLEPKSSSEASSRRKGRRGGGAGRRRRRSWSDGNLNHISVDCHGYYPKRPGKAPGLSKWRKTASLPQIHQASASDSRIPSSFGALAKRNWTSVHDDDIMPRFPRLTSNQYYSGHALASILAGVSTPPPEKEKRSSAWDLRQKEKFPTVSVIYKASTSTASILEQQPQLKKYGEDRFPLVVNVQEQAEASSSGSEATFSRVGGQRRRYTRIDTLPDII